MTQSNIVDLSGAAVVDAHCHAFTADTLTASTARGWLDRITLMGMCLDSSKTADKGMARLLPEMTRSTLLASAANRWLADLLGCDVREVAEVRRDALERDTRGYISKLLAQENVTQLFFDDGYPLPRIHPESFGDLVGAEVHRVVRIEPLIEEAKSSTDSLEEFEGHFRLSLQEAAADPKTVAFKSIIAYRTGLDVDHPDPQEITESYLQWRKSGWQEGRAVCKVVRDHLLNTALDVAREKELPFHIHTGGGDPDVLLPYARPSLLMPLLNRCMDQPIVLIHCGYPWVEETAFLASIFPRVFIDISMLTPWSTLYVDRALEILLGTVPVNKLFHGSDEASEPEIIWLAARLTRGALERVLSRAVELDFLSPGDAQEMGKGVLAGNVLKLHGLT